MKLKCENSVASGFFRDFNLRANDQVIFLTIDHRLLSTAGQVTVLLDDTCIKLVGSRDSDSTYSLEYEQ